MSNGLSPDFVFGAFTHFAKRKINMKFTNLTLSLGMAALIALAVCGAKAQGNRRCT